MKTLKFNHIDKKDKLNLGSGRFKKKNFINIDVDPSTNPDVLYDLNKIPYPFPDNSFSLITANHVLEHLENPFKIMKELHRILKSGGNLIIRVPHFSRAFTHPDHKRGFDVSLPLYFNKRFKGGYTGKSFKLKSMKLKWFAQPYLKKITLSGFQYNIGLFLGKIFDFFANLSPYFCSRIWCYWVGGFEEIEYIFTK
jgi:ubiquinone/menaquinone biosynthesis C-methylase UbiE